MFKAGFSGEPGRWLSWCSSLGHSSRPFSGSLLGPYIFIRRRPPAAPSSTPWASRSSPLAQDNPKPPPTSGPHQTSQGRALSGSLPDDPCQPFGHLQYLQADSGSIHRSSSILRHQHSGSPTLQENLQVLLLRHLSWGPGVRGHPRSQETGNGSLQRNLSFSFL